MFFEEMNVGCRRLVKLVGNRARVSPDPVVEQAHYRENPVDWEGSTSRSVFTSQLGGDRAPELTDS